MSARVKVKRPLPVYVEVEVDPCDLEDAGWVYAGDADENGVHAPQETVLQRLVHEMHDDEHEGPMRWCRHPLCREVDGPA